MRNNFFYKTAFTIVALLATICCSPQQGTVVTAMVDRSQILIGEPIRLSLRADIPESDPIRFFSIDTIPHFELLNVERIDTTNTGTGTVLSQVIHITSFDSGHWIIPPLILGENLATDSIPIDVGFTPFNPDQPYHDVKEIIEVSPEEEKKQQPWWYYLAGAVIAVVLLLLLLRKKKKPVIQQVVIPPDPYKVALQQLQQLRAEKPASREYHSRLVDIFRVYVADRRGIHSLQATTGDLVSQLRTLGMNTEQFNRLADSLRKTDFVKYAKHVPTEEEDRQAYDVIYRSIEQIEQIP